MPDNLDTAFSILQAFQHQYEQMMQRYPDKKLAQSIANQAVDPKASFKHQLSRVKDIVDSTLDLHQRGEAVSCHHLIDDMISLDRGFLNNHLYPIKTRTCRSRCKPALFSQTSYRVLYTQYISPVIGYATAIVCLQCDTDFTHARQVLLYLGNREMRQCNYRLQVMEKNPRLAENFQTIENKLESCKRDILDYMYSLCGIAVPAEITREINDEYSRVNSELEALLI